MGHRAVRRAFHGVERERFVPHDRFLSDRWTGVIEVQWRIDPDRPVVIGAGWYQLHRPLAPPVRRVVPRGLKGKRILRPSTPPRPEVVADIVRRGPEGMPVLPGSSLKGATRQVYELLTPSCEPGARAACRVGSSVEEPQICPACSLFGGAGLGGRLSFGEARPVGDGWRQPQMPRQVPTPWRPRKEVRGTLKVYDQKRAINPQTKLPHTTNESTRCALGTFRSRLRLINAGDEELGLLFGALGLDAGSPMLRVGGRKYHGFGAVDVELFAVRRRYPDVAALAAEDAAGWAADLIRQAMDGHAERRRAWQELHNALASGT